MNKVEHREVMDLYKNQMEGQSQWLMPAIPAIWEEEVKRIAVPDQSEQKVTETLSQKTSWKW
jgi:hypothetical protein